MAIEYTGIDVGFLANEDLSSDKFRFVRLTNGKVERPNAANDKILGVLQNDPAEGEMAAVRISGVSKVVAADAVAVDAWVTAEYNSASDAGKALTTTTDKDVVSGQCIVAAGAEDDLCSIIVTRFTLSAS